MESGNRKTELKAIAGLAVAALIACLSQLQDSGANHLPNGYTRALRIIQSVEVVKANLPHALEAAKKFKACEAVHR